MIKRPDVCNVYASMIKCVYLQLPNKKLEKEELQINLLTPEKKNHLIQNMPIRS